MRKSDVEIKGRIENRPFFQQNSYGDAPLCDENIWIQEHRRLLVELPTPEEQAQLFEIRLFEPEVNETVSQNKTSVSQRETDVKNTANAIAKNEQSDSDKSDASK